MNAEQMFYRLGFIKASAETEELYEERYGNDYIVYDNDDESSYYSRILFNLVDHEVKMSVNEFDLAVFKCIAKQIEELGWEI